MTKPFAYRAFCKTVCWLVLGCLTNFGFTEQTIIIDTTKDEVDNIIVNDSCPHRKASVSFDESSDVGGFEHSGNLSDDDRVIPMKAA